MSEKRNIRDHKRRLLAAKYELRRKLYKAFCKDSDLPSDMRDKLRYNISRSFDGHKEIVLVETAKPIKQGLAPSAAGPQARNRSGGPIYRLCLSPVKYAPKT
ncbi:ribosomal protein S14 [Trifolium repens]|nr:ribosomal protein S14 [Trifolium repens]